MDKTNWLIMILGTSGFFAGVCAVIMTIVHMVAHREEQRKLAEKTCELQEKTELLIRRECEHHERLRSLEKEAALATKSSKPTTTKKTTTVIRSKKTDEGINIDKKTN